MIRKCKDEGTFIQRLDRIKAVIQQTWVLSLANAQKVGKEVEMLQHECPEAAAANVLQHFGDFFFFF